MKFRSLYIRILMCSLTIAAYAYLVYRLVTFDDYSAVVDGFSAAGGYEWLCLLLILLLMPVNVCCEACRWQLLLRGVESVSLLDAHRQVYYGYVGAFVTPGRVGDYPARVLLLRDSSHWSAAVVMGGVGVLAMYLVEIVLGVPAWVLLSRYELGVPMRDVLVAVLVVLLMMTVVFVAVRRLPRYAWCGARLRQCCEGASRLSGRDLLQLLLLSVLRYVVWLVQLSLALRFSGVVLTPVELLMAIPAYYLLLGVVPTVPVADIAVRGSLSILVFGVFSPNTAGIAIAIVVIWIINTMLPMLVGTMVKKNNLQPILTN